MSAATGPKDLVLVIDVSGSMFNNRRARKAREAALTVVDTLYDHDYVGVVLFLPMKTYSDVLLPATTSNREAIKAWLEVELRPKGGTDFQNSLQEAFDMIERSQTKKQNNPKHSL